MKKTILFITLAAGLLACSKEPVQQEETSAGVPMQFEISVAGTKAAKADWAAGDIIYVFFNGLESKYLTLTCGTDGTWENAPVGELTDTDFAGLTPRTLTAVHFPVAVDVDYADGKFSFSVDGDLFYNYYLFDAGTSYDVDGTKVSATLQMGKPDDVALFHIAGIQESVDDYTFGCSLLQPLACESVGTDVVVAGSLLPAGARLSGIADADGGIFAGKLISAGEAADYVFTVTYEDKIYTLLREKRTLEAGKMYIFPALEVTGPDDWMEEDLWVDLGLGVKWATVNLGALSPEQGGDYFAWGETEPKYQPGYALESPCTHWKPGQTSDGGGYNNANYKFIEEGTESWFNIWKYTIEDYVRYTYDGHEYFYPIWYDGDFSKFIGDGKTTFADYDYEDDPVRVNWRGDCRVATIAEWQELLSTSKCTWTWEENYHGAKGWTVTSKVSGYEGASIFLPAGGWREGSYLKYTENGHYWTNSIETYTTKDSRYGQKLIFTSDSHYINSSARTNGLLVRPVKPKGSGN